MVGFLFVFIIQDEPLAVDVLDVDGGIVGQVLSQFGYIYVHDTPVKIIAVAPDLFESRFAAEQFPLLFTKEGKQIGLPGSKRSFLLVFRDKLLLVGIESVSADGINVVGLFF